MEQEKYNMESGEEKAWRELAGAEPASVARNAVALHDPATGAYTLEVLGEEYLIDPKARTVRNLSNPARKPEYFLNLSAPVYLVRSADINPSGVLVKELKGGEFFFRGSHTLPLDAIARKYARDREGFMESGRALGGTPSGMGDASFTFRVFPRVVMCFVLWLEDEEFPARVSLLFDSNAGKHTALDVVWAMALLSCQRMLAHAPTSSQTVRQA